MRPWPALLAALAGALLAAPTRATPVCGNGTVEAGEECDDGNTAEGDCCSRSCAVDPDGALCDDGFFCTARDLCADGVCIGAESPCTEEDGVACTVASCDEELDACSEVPDHSLCSDGVFCNGVEVCLPPGVTPGGCREALAPVECGQLSDRCRRGVCDEVAGSCTTEPTGDPLCDRDGDGLSAEEDRCPHTPPGAFALFPGCAPVDLVRRPQVVLDPVGAALMEAADALRADDALRKIVAKLEKSAGKLARVDALLRTGDLCKGARLYGKLLVKLERTGGSLERKLAKLDRDVLAQEAVMASLGPRGVFAGEGDHRPLDLERLRIERLGAVFQAALASALGAGSQLDDACGAVMGRASRRGTIEEIDDDGGIVLLDDGSAVAVGSKPSKRQLGPGIEVAVDGFEFADATMAGDVEAAVSSTDADIELSPFTCLDLRVVPFQDYLFKSVAEMTVLPLEGYRLIGSDKHAFENRMWLTAEAKDTPGCPTGGVIGTFKRRSFKLVVKQPGKPTKIMAWDLAPGELAPFPGGIDPAKDAFLEVTARVQNCSLLTGCPDVFEEVSGTQTFRIGVLGLGAYCVADYASTEFALEDVNFVIGQPTAFPQFRPATVEGVLSLFLQVDPGTSPAFTAEAYEIHSGVSSYPNAELIGAGSEFAIYQNHDFYWEYLFPFESTGVQGPVGLKWPRVVAVRNQNFIQYHCNTPSDLVRDVVDFCPAGPDSYYRLPFTFGLGQVTQGNNGAFTHNGAQAYAFDLLFGGNVRAARGGTVTFVRESIPSSSNCYDANTTPACQNANNPGNGCTANVVTIKHQDGTEGQYFHMPMNGVFVSQGDRVRRGATIAQVDNTGCSSDPHLHFHSVSFPSSSQTVPIRFEQLVGDCTIPPSNSFVFSNNPKY